jgi:hypothetical protein
MTVLTLMQHLDFDGMAELYAFDGAARKWLPYNR